MKYSYILYSSHSHNVKKGEFVYIEGESVENFYIIKSGLFLYSYFFAIF